MRAITKISRWQKLLSYLVPINIAHYQSNENPYLELLLYRNQFQLATEDALYSDGTRYLPFKKAFKKLPKSFWKECNRVLILGVGLGSAVQILRQHYAPTAFCTLVDYDREILLLATRLLAEEQPGNLEFVAADAFQYVTTQQSLHEVICIDIFKNRVAPSECVEWPFLSATQKLLHPNGYWIMNYITHDPLLYYQLRKNLDLLFHEVQVINFNQNIVLIAQGPKANSTDIAGG